jgi:hypothetical protein
MITFDHPELDTEIRGTIAFNPTDDRLLIFRAEQDTLPQDGRGMPSGLDTVDGVINPHQKFPTSTMNPNGGLPPQAVGQRYLIVDNVGFSDVLRLQYYGPYNNNADPTQFYVQTAINADNYMNYVGKPIFCKNSYGQECFQAGTTIDAITLERAGYTSKAPYVYLLKISQPPITGAYLDNAVIETNEPVDNDAWGELRANANDIIEYGINTVSVKTTEAVYAGSRVITISDTNDIRVGYDVQLGGSSIGTVEYINNGSVTIDTALSQNLPAGTSLTFESDGPVWYVAYDSQAATEPGFVTNTKTMVQYRYNGDEWVKSYEGFYAAGDWNIVI